MQQKCKIVNFFFRFWQPNGACNKPPPPTERSDAEAAKPRGVGFIALIGVYKGI